ncbi:hypothetical protein K491DRAFT_719025 [Lophiostoma macrostomum CBS 122681]|uniref:Knr4/Smi1-like domain-containing protein n=1 Tax=Lophiostoma macrostomum CBS 122681 TaxID=1314788 RepID=A0A6A6SX98_9PLEO|nr:hypothetical protein K491DRAFT_719025 [Lophiostoma macrostomum CBS 122681]
MPSKACLSAYIDNILYADGETTTYTIARLAHQFALLGHVDTASKLVSQLNEFDYHHLFMYSLEPLWLLWHLQEQWPRGEKDRVLAQIRTRKIGSQEGKDEASKVGTLDSGPGFKDEDISEEDIAKYMEDHASMYAQQWHWPGPSTQSQNPSGAEKSDDDLDKNPHTIAEKTREMARHAITRLVDASDSPGLQSGLVSALDQRLRFSTLNDDGDQDKPEASVPSASLILSKIAKHLDAKTQLELGQSPALWTFLRTRALTTALELSSPENSTFETQVLDAVSQRLTHGRQDAPSVATLDLKGTLLAMQHNTQTNTEAVDWFQEMRYPVPETLFRDPATAADIAALEDRLGVRLPEDYKDFLRLSNGFGAAFGGISFEAPLHGAADVKRVPGDESDGWRDLLPLEVPGEPVWKLCGVEYDDWPKISWAIEIGTQDIYNTWLVPPSVVSQVKEKVAAALARGEDNVKTEVDERTKENLRRRILDWAGSWEVWEGLEWCTMCWTAGSGPEMRCWPTFNGYLERVAGQGLRSLDEVMVADGFFGGLLEGRGGC